jgi:hypothetical protein
MLRLFDSKELRKMREGGTKEGRKKGRKVERKEGAGNCKELHNENLQGLYLHVAVNIKDEAGGAWHMWGRRGEI